MKKEKQSAWQMIGAAALLTLAAPLLLVFLVPLLIYWVIATLCFQVAIASVWVSRGTRFLVIYSDSSQWKEFFETQVLTALGSSTRFINLSTDGGKKGKWDLDWRFYRHTCGYRNRFPVVYRFSRFGGWKTIRFYQAFIDAKHGKPEALVSAKSVLYDWIEKSTNCRVAGATNP